MISPRRHDAIDAILVIVATWALISDIVSIFYHMPIMVFKVIVGTERFI